MRRLAAWLGASALLLASTGTVSGAAVVRQTDISSHVTCTVDTPIGTADLGVFVSQAGGPDAYLDVFSDQPDPVLTRDPDLPVSVTITATTVSASIPLLPSGVGTVTGTRVATDTFAYTNSFKSGNHWFKENGAGQNYSFSGTLTLPGVATPIPLPAESCGSADQTVTTAFNQPHSNINAFVNANTFCDVINGDGDHLGVFIDASNNQLFIDGTVDDSTGARVSTTGNGDLSAAGTATVALSEYDPDTGVFTGVTGSATVSVTDMGSLGTFVVRYTNESYRINERLLDVEGTLSTSLGSFSLNDCNITQQQTKRISTPSNGPKPSGKVPSNDLPANAIPIKPGYAANVATKGAERPNEGRFDCLEFPDDQGGVFALPVEFTVWYRFTGNGNPITIDTAGSGYDTAIAVYAGAPGAIPTAACVDDVPLVPIGFSVQSAVTLTGRAGTQYWVQIGGLDETNPASNTTSNPFGTLRVSVR